MNRDDDRRLREALTDALLRARFQRDMVYSDLAFYTDALVTISALAEQVTEH